MKDKVLDHRNELWSGRVSQPSIYQTIHITQDGLYLQHFDSVILFVSHCKQYVFFDLYEKWKSSAATSKQLSAFLRLLNLDPAVQKNYPVFKDLDAMLTDQTSPATHAMLARNYLFAKAHSEYMRMKSGLRHAEIVQVNHVPGTILRDARVYLTKTAFWLRVGEVVVAMLPFDADVTALVKKRQSIQSRALVKAMFAWFNRNYEKAHQTHKIFKAL